MQELPVYPTRGDRRHLDLVQERGRLAAKGAHRPDRVQVAIQDLKTECVTETLRLTGVPGSSKDVARFARGEPTDSRNGELIRGQLAALEAIDRFAQRHPMLERSLVREVHRLSSPPMGGTFRRGPVRKPFSETEPSRPELVSDQIDDLMEWLAAESVRKMHVVEKAALAFARLMEISPFETGNFRTAHLLLSFFALAENYPPIFLRLEEVGGLRRDIELAIRLDTAPLVSRLSEALARSLAVCMDAVMEKSRFGTGMHR
jgi:hypothetical protein